MTALDRKLLRDLWQLKSQALAIMLVLSSGVAVMVMTISTLESLAGTKQTYFDRYRLADVFAQLKRAPNSLAERVAAIPGVASVQTRVVVDVTLDVPGLAEPAIGRLISIPNHGDPVNNALHLRQGRYPEPGRAGEVLVNEAFAMANGFELNNILQAVINGRRQRLQIVGIALSPEYVIQIQGAALLPDDRRFGVFWMSESVLAPAHGLEGAFNDVTLRLLPGASTKEVIRRLDRLLAPYGGQGAYDREDQVSARYLSEEIQQLRSMGMLVPTIFLGVAGFLLHVVLQRLVATQRPQIAVLKAFGYAQLQVGWHFLKMVLVILALGSLIGIAVGAWLGHGMTMLYTRFYRFPIFNFELEPSVVVLAVGFGTAVALAGVLGAVRRAAILPPAEAMRPQPPTAYRPAVIERLGLQRFFSQGARMVLRHLERRPGQAGLTILGIAMAAAVMIVGSFSKDSLEYLAEFQFHLTQRQDITVTLIEPTEQAVLHEFEHLPGVLRAEPVRALPVRMRKEHRSERLAIQGLSQDRDLYQLLNTREEPVDLPPRGVVLNTKLAELLNARLGDQVEVEIMEGERPRRNVTVSGLVQEYAGVKAYMEISELNRLAREGPTVSGAQLLIDPQHLEELYRTLKETPRVAMANIKEAALRSFQETVVENLGRLRLFNMVFASIIAFGVVYNNARISLSERQRELGTLRVLGFRRREISLILLGELAVLTLVAVPLGLLIGRGLVEWMAQGLETELYRIPAMVSPSTYGLAGVTVLVAAVVSGLVVRHRLDHLDLISVLKEQEA